MLSIFILLLQFTRQFSVEFTEDAEETVLLETELIREWKPKTNLKMNPDKS